MNETSLLPKKAAPAPVTEVQADLPAPVMRLRYEVVADLGCGFMFETFYADVPYATGQQIDWPVPAGDEQWDLIPGEVVSCRPVMVPVPAAESDADPF